jgi:hypothetical protein
MAGTAVAVVGGLAVSLAAAAVPALAAQHPRAGYSGAGQKAQALRLPR